MKDDWQHEMDRLIAAWDRITGEQRTELVEQVREAVANDDVGALSELVVSTDAADDLLTAHMVAMALIGANEVVAEAQEQEVETEPVVPSEDDIHILARVVVTMLARGLGDSAGREAMRVWGPESTPEEVASHIDEYIRSLSDRALRDQLGGAMTNAQNKGRFSTLLSAPQAVWYASERNDSNACGPCSRIDDHKFTTLEDAYRAYPNGGYANCEGGVRCRGGVVPVWGTE